MGGRPPLCPARPGEQQLGRRQRRRRAPQDLAQHAGQHPVQRLGAAMLVRQPQRVRSGGVQPRAGDGEAARHGRADAFDEEGRDLRRHRAERGPVRAEAGALDRDRDVGDAGQPTAPSRAWRRVRLRAACAAVRRSSPATSRCARGRSSVTCSAGPSHRSGRVVKGLVIAGAGSEPAGPVPAHFYRTLPASSSLWKLDPPPVAVQPRPARSASRTFATRGAARSISCSSTAPNPSTSPGGMRARAQ